MTLCIDSHIAAIHWRQSRLTVHPDSPLQIASRLLEVVHGSAFVDAQTLQCKQPRQVACTERKQACIPSNSNICIAHMLQVQALLPEQTSVKRSNASPILQSMQGHPEPRLDIQVPAVWPWAPACESRKDE